MTPDDELLERFVRERDENAFREIVERHAGMVIGTARRRTGDIELARDVAQSVFTLLARTAARLRHGADRRLAGWLHRTALLQASNALRTEMRRRHHLEAYANQVPNTTSPAGRLAWDEALPMIDTAIDTLPGKDRDLVLMHYFQRRTFREIGSLIGASEEAVRKRTSRALEKLSGFFRRRGVSLSAAALASGLAAEAAEAAPVGFAASATAAAIGGSSAISSTTILVNSLATTMTLTKITAVAAAVAFATPIGWRWHETRAAQQNIAHLLPANLSTRAAASSAGGLAHPAAAPASPVLARFAQELRTLGNSGEDALRLIELQRLLLELPEADLPEAFQLVQQTPKEKGTGQLLYALFARWAEFGIDKALTASRDLAVERRVSAQTGVLLVWTRQDINAALAWVLAQPAGDVRVQLLDMAYHQLMKTDPEAALAKLPQVPDEAKRIQYRRWTFEVWRASDPEAALAWLREKEPEETRTAATQEFLHQMAGYRPDLAFKYALEQENPHLREDAARFALMQWAFHDTKAALEALTQLPPDLQTESVAINTVPFLAAADVNALIEAAGQLPTGTFRDSVVGSAGAALVATDPQRALDTVGARYHRNQPREGL
ncbi:MAG: RNA polymerase sigma factor [Verrucomicrobiales bacterium]